MKRLSMLPPSFYEFNVLPPTGHEPRIAAVKFRSIEEEPTNRSPSGVPFYICARGAATPTPQVPAFVLCRAPLSLYISIRYV